MTKTTVRVRGMNAAATIGMSQNGDATDRRQQFPHASMRQLLVAIAILGAGGVIAWFTITQVNGHTGFAGTVQPTQSVNLDFAQTGRVSQLLVKPGDHVVKGQSLAVQDETVASSTLLDAQAVLSADQAKLAALQSPAVSTTAKQNLDLAVQKANTQLAGAQKASSDAGNAANNQIAQAQQALSAAQGRLNSDSAQFQSDCDSQGGNGSCANLASQVQQDTVAVSNASANLAHIQATATQTQDSATSAVSTARAALALAQNQEATATAPASAADISSAEADVAAAQTSVDQAKAGLAALTLVSPIDGIVADVGGIVGELDGTTGVHAFAGPQSLNNSGGSAFSLFPPAAGTGATQNSANSGQQALISLVTMQSNAIVQVSEDTVPTLHAGRSARVTVNALHQTVSGTVAQVIPIPVNQGGTVEYEVRLTVPAWPTGTEPGMSLSVVFP